MSAARFPVVADLGTGFGTVAFALDPETLGQLAVPLLAAAAETHAAAHTRAVAHVREATESGGIRVAVRQHPPEVVAIAPPAGWRMVVALPTASTAETTVVRNAMPRDVPAMKHYRQAALTAALVLGLERGDAVLVRVAADDAIIEPALGPRLPGFFPVRAAAVDAGALLVGFDARVGCTAALVASPEVGDRVAVAMRDAFAAHATPCDIAVAVLAQIVPGGTP